MISSKNLNSNLKQLLKKNNFVDKNQESIAQQLDIRTNEQSQCNSQTTLSTKETITTENNTQHKEMHDKTTYLWT